VSQGTWHGADRPTLLVVVSIDFEQVDDSSAWSNKVWLFVLCFKG